MCTREEKNESRNLARQIAITNGYETIAFRNRSKEKTTMRLNEDFSLNKVPFNLPFISDEVTVAIKRCLKRVGLENSVYVIEQSPNTLRQKLVRNRLYDRLCSISNCVISSNGRDGDCMSSGTVYLLSCRACGDEYIYETGRLLCVRLKEHLDGKIKTRQNTPPRNT